MRFASINASDASQYARAGKAGADSLAKTFEVQRKTGPDYAGLSKVAMVTQSEEKIEAMKAAEKVTNAGVNAFSHVKQIANNEGAKRKIREIDRNLKSDFRKAGAVAGLGKLAGAAYLSSRKDERELPTNSKEKRAFLEQSIKQQQGILEQMDANDRKGIDDGDALINNNTPTYSSPSTGSDSGKVIEGGSSTTASQTGTLSTGTTLTGNAKTIADAIAKYESGDWGYEAFNQGGRAGGTRVVGKSGSHKDTFGRSLTDMTLGEIFHRQNTKQRGLSFQQHLDQGGLHAVGRYQFIGSTLQDEVRRMGLDHNTKFTPEIQDQIFLSHVKRVGNISPWVGPMQHYSSAQRSQFNSMIQGL